MDPATREEIMRATYRALCEHGYADVTMQDIADESGKSTAALHYHYDTKRDLLLAFLDYLFDSFIDRLDEAEEGHDDPAERLLSVVDMLLTPRSEDSHTEFQTAILETKAQGPYDDQFREKHVRIDDHMQARFETILRDGVDDGTFAPRIDPAETAAFLSTLVSGCHVRQVSTGRDIDPVRRRLYDYVRTALVADDARGVLSG